MTDSLLVHWIACVGFSLSGTWLCSPQCLYPLLSVWWMRTNYRHAWPTVILLHRTIHPAGRKTDLFGSHESYQLECAQLLLRWIDNWGVSDGIMWLFLYAGLCYHWTELQDLLYQSTPPALIQCNAVSYVRGPFQPNVLQIITTFLEKTAKENVDFHPSSLLTEMNSCKRRGSDELPSVSTALLT